MLRRTFPTDCVWTLSRATSRRQVWTRFWSYANDPGQATAAGIRVAQGEAVHTRAVRGQVYKVTLSASHGLSLVPRLPGAMVGDTPDADVR